MEKITEFFKEFKNRVTNPLIFSFLVSWLIINWKVTVAVLFYNSKSIAFLNYKNYYDVIMDNCSSNNYFWRPLWFAILYTFLFPPLRLIIVSFLSLFKKWTNNLNLFIMKDANVPMNRFIKETERSDKLAKSLEELYKKDSKIAQLNDTLKAEVVKLSRSIADFESQVRSKEATIMKLENTIEEYSKLNSKRLINGRWKLITDKINLIDISGLSKYEIENMRQKITVMIKIYDGNISIQDSKEAEHSFANVVGFAYDFKSAVIQLTLKKKSLHPVMLVPINDLPMLSFQQLKFEIDSRGDIMKMNGTDENSNSWSYHLEYTHEELEML